MSDTPTPPAAPAPPAARRAGRSRDALLLGLHVTPKQVFGVLVRPAPDGGYEPLRQFVRNRADGSSGAAGDTGALTPEGVALAEESYAGSAADGIQFGGAAEIDFTAEFAGLSAPSLGFDLPAAGAAAEGAAVLAKPVFFEIRDILEECAQAGFPAPTLSFVVGAPDVEYVEVLALPEKKAAPKKAKAKPGKAAEAEETSAAGKVAPVKRERLVALLLKQAPHADRERTAFVPMTPRDGHARYLAVVPTATEPVVPSLRMLREQADTRRTAVRTLEAEVSLLVGLARMTTPAETGENTALVRVGTEDTLVLLLVGGQLHHAEVMPSVTAYDGPDTICSRVLLQQDVQGVGTVHNVVVMTDDREAELVQGFAAFYPEARVSTLRESLAGLGLVGPYGPLAPSLVEAAGAAVAGHARRGKSPFEDVNLIPESLLRSSVRLDLSFAWHTAVVAALLFLSVLFFVYTYIQNADEIAQAEQTLAEFPPETRMSAPQLQARIDSLRLRQQELTANLVLLDSLLIGTDRWTQATLTTTRAAAATGGLWIEEWQPNGDEVQLRGYATTRARVVSMAQRLNATINEVTFQALREIPVFEYRMSLALPNELPQVARVLREQAGETLPPPAPLPLAGLGAQPAASAAPPPAAPPPPAPDPAAAPAN